MQVRPIEFQESFSRLPVEQARQQHVLQREPDLARDQSARIASAGHLLDLTRPVPTSEAEGAIIRSDQERPFEQPPRRDRRSQPDHKESPAPPILGRHLDVIG